MLLCDMVFISKHKEITMAEGLGSTEKGASIGIKERFAQLVTQFLSPKNTYDQRGFLIHSKNIRHTKSSVGASAAAVAMLLAGCTSQTDRPEPVSVEAPITTGTEQGGQQTSSYSPENQAILEQMGAVEIPSFIPPEETTAVVEGFADINGYQRTILNTVAESEDPEGEFMDWQCVALDGLLSKDPTKIQTIVDIMHLTPPKLDDLQNQSILALSYTPGGDVYPTLEPIVDQTGPLSDVTTGPLNLRVTDVMADVNLIDNSGNNVNYDANRVLRERAILWVSAIQNVLLAVNQGKVVLPNEESPLPTGVTSEENAAAVKSIIGNKTPVAKDDGTPLSNPTTFQTTKDGKLLVGERLTKPVNKLSSLNAKTKYVSVSTQIINDYGYGRSGPLLFKRVGSE